MRDGHAVLDVTKSNTEDSSRFVYRCSIAFNSFSFQIMLKLGCKWIPSIFAPSNFGVHRDCNETAVYGWRFLFGTPKLAAVFSVHSKSATTDFYGTCQQLVTRRRFPKSIRYQWRVLAVTVVAEQESVYNSSLPVSPLQAHLLFLCIHS